VVFPSEVFCAVQLHAEPWGEAVTTHTVTCLCGYSQAIDGWLDALEISRLHSRTPGCDAVVDLHYSKETA